MSVSVRAVLVEGPASGPRLKGPYTYASTPRALYNNAKLRRDPSWPPPPATVAARRPLARPPPPPPLAPRDTDSPPASTNLTYRKCS
ncbi:unnamed protein product, partial [Brenthis ino]